MIERQEIKPLAFDRTITFGVLLALCVQTTGALLWAGGAAARLSALEAKHNMHPPVSERLARIEEQVGMTRRSLTRIEARLDSQYDAKGDQ